MEQPPTWGMGASGAAPYIGGASGAAPYMGDGGQWSSPLHGGGGGGQWSSLINGGGGGAMEQPPTCTHGRPVEQPLHGGGGGAVEQPPTYGSQWGSPINRGGSGGRRKRQVAFGYFHPLKLYMNNLKECPLV